MGPPDLGVRTVRLGTGANGGTDWDDATVAAWDHAARTSGAPWFAGPSWVAAWAATFEPDAPVDLLIDEETGGVLPLTTTVRALHHRVPGGLRHRSIAGSWSGAADHLGPATSSVVSARRLLAAADRGAAADGLPLVLTNVAERHLPALDTLHGAIEIGRTYCAVVDVAGVDELEAAWGRKLSKDLRRRRRLLDDAGVERRWVDDPDEVVALLPELRRLHLARWAGRGGGLFDERRLSFLERLATGRPGGLVRAPGATAGAGDDGMRILVMSLPEGPIAALAGLQYGSTFCAYKSGWDPSRAPSGAGILLHEAALRRAAEVGITRYDLLRGPHPHKLQLGAHVEVNLTVVVPHGLRGRLLAARDRAYTRRVEAQYRAEHPDENPR